jgi:hypothetical protein
MKEFEEEYEELEKEEAAQEEYDLKDWEEVLEWQKEIETLPDEDCPYWEE